MTETAEREYLLCAGTELDPDKTFLCGQCFRWRPDGRGGWEGAALSRAARVRLDPDGTVRIGAPREDLPFWRAYFDLDTDYGALRRQAETCGYMRECSRTGAGIRILRQDPWEALCTFILSQCNNIPRIAGIVERLCALCGEPMDVPGGAPRFAFPSAARVAGLTPEALAPLRAGYRTGYVLSAARAVDSGALSFAALSRAEASEARAALKRLPGVGDKVADCALLYGLHRMDAFPVDTWMRKALSAHFPPDFDPGVFGPCAGLAQQYIFYRERETARRRPAADKG